MPGRTKLFISRGDPLVALLLSNKLRDKLFISRGDPLVVLLLSNKLRDKLFISRGNPLVVLLLSNKVRDKLFKVAYNVLAPPPSPQESSELPHCMRLPSFTLSCFPKEGSKGPTPGFPEKP